MKQPFGISCPKCMGLTVAAILVIAGIFLIWKGQTQMTPVVPLPVASDTDTTIKSTGTPGAYSSSAKGVIQVANPESGQEIRSPLTVTGLVYGNTGTLTIKLKQKESGSYVTEDKVVAISGKSDTISFAEAIQFGLPAMPQPGILEVAYQDKSGQGLDDRVSVEIYFPGDLGKGE